MLTPASVLLLVVMLSFCMAVVSIDRVGIDGEYEPSDRLFRILQPWSICTGGNSRIKSEVRVITAVLLALKFRSVYPTGGSKKRVMILLAVVDPDVVIELNARAVDDVMEAFLVDSLSLISVCENVFVFVYTSAELAFVAIFLYGVVEGLAVVDAFR